MRRSMRRSSSRRLAKWLDVPSGWCSVRVIRRKDRMARHGSGDGGARGRSARNSVESVRLNRFRLPIARAWRKRWSGRGVRERCRGAGLRHGDGACHGACHGACERSWPRRRAPGVRVHDPAATGIGATLRWMTGVASRAMGVQNAFITRISSGVVRVTSLRISSSDADFQERAPLRRRHPLLRNGLAASGTPRLDPLRIRPQQRLRRGGEPQQRLRRGGTPQQRLWRGGTPRLASGCHARADPAARVDHPRRSPRRGCARTHRSMSARAPAAAATAMTSASAAVESVAAIGPAAISTRR